MDDRCFDILTDLRKPRFIPVRLSDYESQELLKIKPDRSVGEYCWTNSSCFTSFIMNKYKPDYCAYIDSDLYFYDDPNIVISEMEQYGASVMITGHRFNRVDRKELIWKVGRYCVEFNTFKNDRNGLFLLERWKQQCLEYCKSDGDGIHWADQKYLDNWCEDYSFCIETTNIGAGVAPWNIAQYKMLDSNDFGPTYVRSNGIVQQLFFYHFQGITYIDNHTAKLNVFTSWGVSKEMVNSLYINYLRHIASTKELLSEKYGVTALIKKHPGVVELKNPEPFRLVLKRLFSISGISHWLCRSIPSRLFGRYNVVHF